MRLIMASRRSGLRRFSRALPLWAAMLGLWPAQAAFAQDAAEALQPGRDILVLGHSDVPKSDWKRVEGDHVVLFGKGGDNRLKGVVTDLERLHALMTRLYRPGAAIDETQKLRVTLIESAADFRALRLQDLRSQEGPFSDGFPILRYYDPRETGEVLAVAMADEVVKLDTRRRFNEDCDEFLAAGGTENCGAVIRPPAPVARSWKTRLYAAFAQHFIATYAPNADPRWYLDAIGALFSTVQVHGDGTVDYALPPDFYDNVFRSYGYPDVEAILTGRYLEPDAKSANWSPYAAWLLAHYFLYSDLKPERAAQFRDYMAAVRQGVPMAQAAALFGDMNGLQRDLQRYARKANAYARTGAPQGQPGEPYVTQLSAIEGTVVEARLMLETRLAERDAASGEPDWLATLRSQIAAAPFDRGALLFLAEAECRSGQDAACLAAAEKLLAKMPDDVAGLAWQGMALTGLAHTAAADEQAPMLSKARQAIARAMTLDSEAPLPRIAYFQSFAQNGEAMPDEAMGAMAQAIRAVPAAPAPRLYLARELLRRGQSDLARRVIAPVLHGPYTSPERMAAMALFPDSPPSAALSGSR